MEKPEKIMFSQNINFSTRYKNFFIFSQGRNASMLHKRLIQNANVQYKKNSLREYYTELIKNNKKLMAKSQHRCRSKTHNVFPEQVNKIILIDNDDKRMQSIDSIGTFAFEKSKDYIVEKKKLNVTI